MAATVGAIIWPNHCVALPLGANIMTSNILLALFCNFSGGAGETKSRVAADAVEQLPRKERTSSNIVVC